MVCDPPLTTQSSNELELKRLEESLQLLWRQREMPMQEKDLAEKLQHHFEVSQLR